MVVYGFPESPSTSQESILDDAEPRPEHESNDLQETKTNDEDVYFNACVNGDVDAVLSFLINRPEAALFARDALGRTAFHVAVEHEHVSIARLLADRGAEVNAPDSEGRTPLATAVICAENEETLLFLVGEGLDLNWKDEKGSNLLHLAASKFNYVSTAILAALGFDLDVQRCADAKTPVHVVSETRDDDIFLAFLEDLGANMRLRDATGKTPLHLAVEHGFVESTRFLTSRTIPISNVPTSGKADSGTCSICEEIVVDIMLVPCGHRVCERCSPRWKRCHVTISNSVCGIVCGTIIEGRRKIVEAGADADDDDHIEITEKHFKRKQ